MQRVWVAIVLGVAAAWGCGATVFVCSDDASCSGGVCQANGFCSFPDEDCASMQRYGEHAPSGFAGECVGAEAGSGSGSDGGSGTTTATASTTIGTSLDATSLTTTTVGSSDSGSDTGNHTTTMGTMDMGGMDECSTIEFDVVPLPGWQAFSTSGTVSVSDGKMSLTLQTSTDSECGLQRTSTDTAQRRFRIEMLAVPALDSEAQIGLELTVSDELTYLVALRQGAVIAAMRQGAEEISLASIGLGEQSSVTALSLLVGDMVSMRYSLNGSIEEDFVWDEPTAVDLGSVAVRAASPASNEVDPGTIVVERLIDCPL
ncbi:MAG: hypothetical protein K1X88_34955 [Nannocystaceae bacterium]|nr:hypothetical protein [Nannocystaceae bacterium]